MIKKVSLSHRILLSDNHTRPGNIVISGNCKTQLKPSAKNIRNKSLAIPLPAKLIGLPPEVALGLNTCQRQRTSISK